MKKLLIALAFAATLTACNCGSSDNNDDGSIKTTPVFFFDPNSVQLGVNEEIKVVAAISGPNFESGTTIPVNFVANLIDAVTITPNSCVLSAPDYSCNITVVKNIRVNDNIYVAAVLPESFNYMINTLLTIESK